eukprot:scaffold83813_cov33-Prasinocladus_malaysianus.AAC.1
MPSELLPRVSRLQALDIHDSMPRVLSPSQKTALIWSQNTKPIAHQGITNNRAPCKSESALSRTLLVVICRRRDPAIMSGMVWIACQMARQILLPLRAMHHAVRTHRGSQ